jgi:hypothetical protein
MYKNREDKKSSLFFYFNVHKTIDNNSFMYYNISTLKEINTHFNEKEETK